MDPRLGRWIARNPESTWGDGYWIGHPMVPWLNHDEMLDRQRTDDIAKFKNEVLGLSTTAGDHVVTRAELEACCGKYAMAAKLADVPAAGRKRLIAGIDWGGGGRSRTELVIGYMREDFHFQICRFERFPATEDPGRVLAAVAQRCKEFGVWIVSADGGGNGHVFNRLLVDRLGAQGMYAILYSATSHEPHQEGVLTKWTVDRSSTIGALFSRVKRRQISFPRVADCGSYLDEFACEYVEFDDSSRSVRYTHPESQTDDALHATNYALVVAVRAFHHEIRCDAADM